MRKGIAFLWISVFFALLSILLMLLFYFLFFSSSAAPREIGTTESSAAVAHNVLAQYLGAPVAVEGQAIPMADLVRLWYSDRAKYKPILEAKTGEFLALTDYATLDAEGKARMHKPWVAIHEQGPGGKVLATFRNPGTARTSPGKAETFVPVSGTGSVRVILWNPEVES